MKDQYEKAVRADASVHPAGYPRFAIRPPGARPEYVVIEYVSPFTGNERSLGLDLMADPARRQAVERARDTGTMVATGAIALVSTGEPGVSMGLAAHLTHAFCSTQHLRREPFRG